MRQDVFHGYRGTAKKYTKLIKYKEDLKKSEGEDEYFGHGIYFFENDKREAHNWAKYVRKYTETEISVIYVYIKTESILDFFDSETYEDYIKIVDTIKERYKEQKSIPKFVKPVDCNLINNICDKKGYKLVRGGFPPNHKKGNMLIKDDFTRIGKIHIQLCVRDVEIIKEYKILY